MTKKMGKSCYLSRSAKLVSALVLDRYTCHPGDEVFVDHGQSMMSLRHADSYAHKFKYKCILIAAVTYRFNQGTIHWESFDATISSGLTPLLGIIYGNTWHRYCVQSNLDLPYYLEKFCSLWIIGLNRFHLASFHTEVPPALWLVGRTGFA